MSYVLSRAQPVTMLIIFGDIFYLLENFKHVCASSIFAYQFHQGCKDESAHVRVWENLQERISNLITFKLVYSSSINPRGSNFSSKRRRRHLGALISHSVTRSVSIPIGIGSKDYSIRRNWTTYIVSPI